MRDFIVLVGMMGSGKSSVGRAVALLAQCDFIDSDDVIEQQEGCSIADIFTHKGEAGFRAIEKETILTMMQERKNALVMSVGGGAFMNKNVRLAILSQAMVVWLDAPLDVLAVRCSGKNRPLLAHNKEETLERLIKERAPFYAQAHHRVEVGAQSILQLAHLIFEKWNKQ